MVFRSRPDGCVLCLDASVAGRRDPGLAAAIRHGVDDGDARLAKLVDEATTDGLCDPDLDRFATVRLAHAIGFGMTLTQAMGLEMPAPEAWTTLIDRVIAAVAVPGPQPTTDPSRQTGDPK